MNPYEYTMEDLFGDNTSETSDNSSTSTEEPLSTSWNLENNSQEPDSNSNEPMMSPFQSVDQEINKKTEPQLDKGKAKDISVEASNECKLTGVQYVHANKMCRGMPQ
ncbi:hypothetical protein TREMEDRAFT_60707 [Tremella mesenterica DSM 1558]|uniref:uncharacterized protein n=1 Tax=Tremella mesenterica (strain ATCC 24925 / CBS 8224 / DSM 1558 / NBRC 9311 / NRRL Y-6157 / RJB 2259-6 / UBC 559-6) TaxID=578456 RepID=UPI0003F4A3DD|nr:uncharacterized protein TREMEDRAFT_60707 [Tremella mesenterica DSM 1558]EIW71791.1 hypothetical protein TREMEDRAFT_60707 [Tremella mesenterica DSM 1558]